MKTVFIFVAGFAVGAGFVLNEIVHERLLVSNNLEGGMTIHWPGTNKKQAEGE